MTSLAAQLRACKSGQTFLIPHNKPHYVKTKYGGHVVNECRVRRLIRETAARNGMSLKFTISHVTVDGNQFMAITRRVKHVG